MSENMSRSFFSGVSLGTKILVGIAFSTGLAIAAYSLIADGDVSSEDIDKIFNEALKENPERVTELCDENLKESNKENVQAFLQNNSGLNINVDDDVLGTVIDKCIEILVSTTTVISSEAPDVAIEDDTTPTSTSSTTTTTYEDESDNEDNDEYTVSVTPECDETLSKEYSNDPSQVTVTVVEATMSNSYGDEYPGILLCWEPMLVDNVEPEQYWISFGYTLDEYIYNDSTYDTGIIFSVGTAGGYINFDGDEPLLTKYFFETEYFFYEPETEEFVKNGKLTIYFNIAAYNEKTDSYYSDSTKTVSITINDPRD